MKRWESLWYAPEIGLTLDFSGMPSFAPAAEGMAAAIEAMAALEAGAIANGDENRMVGHYWLRNPALAPNLALAGEIRKANRAVAAFADAVRWEEKWDHVLLIGIGGSSLGPAFVADALGGDGLSLHFMDNTDPDGMDRLFARLENEWKRTLVLVISKSGGTVETRNGLEETRLRYEKAGLFFPCHAVAVTVADSRLDQLAKKEKWLASFPIWDWVGGRTSVLSPAGLLPLALAGVDIEGLIAGAAACDECTRRRLPRENPAALLAAAWHHLTEGKGGKEMVLLPYKDRLGLLAKYMQQLVMESLGKEEDRAGNRVRQGLTVFGNKGSSDQHSYVQQLLAGPATFFAVFIEVLADRAGPSPVVGEDSTSGDYLQAFLLGTGRALARMERPFLTVGIPRVDSFSVGVLLALFERAVGLYAELVNVNAYHQPAVEMGKRSADLMIALKNAAVAALLARPGEGCTASALAARLETEQTLPPGLDRDEAPYYLLRILRHLAANPGPVGVEEESGPLPDIAATRFYGRG